MNLESMIRAEINLGGYIVKGLGISVIGPGQNSKHKEEQEMLLTEKWILSSHFDCSNFFEDKTLR